jgi:hypothetical protein
MTISMRRKARYTGTARPQTSAVHGRSAPLSGGVKARTLGRRLTGHHHDCDAGHLAGLASSVDACNTMGVQVVGRDDRLSWRRSER